MDDNTLTKESFSTPESNLTKSIKSSNDTFFTSLKFKVTVAKPDPCVEAHLKYAPGAIDGRTAPYSDMSTISPPFSHTDSGNPAEKKVSTLSSSAPIAISRSAHFPSQLPAPEPLPNHSVPDGRRRKFNGV